MMPPPCAFTRWPAVSRKLTPVASAPEIVPTGPVQLLAPPLFAPPPLTLPPFAPPIPAPPLPEPPLLEPPLLEPPSARPPSALAGLPPTAPLTRPPSASEPPRLPAALELLPQPVEHSTKQHSSAEHGIRIMSLIGKRLTLALLILKVFGFAARFAAKSPCPGKTNAGLRLMEGGSIRVITCLLSGAAIFLPLWR